MVFCDNGGISGGNDLDERVIRRLGHVLGMG